MTRTLRRRQLPAVSAAAALVISGRVSAQSPRRFKFAYDQPVNTGYGIIGNTFSDKLKDMSKGTMLIDQYPGAQLGQEPQVLQLVKSGDIDFCISASANAADMAARPYTKAPPAIAALYDWSGFYVGANAGYASSWNCWNFESFAGAPFTAGEGCHDADGAVVGGQIGYRWQSSAFVFGLEAQGNWADLSGSSVSTPAFVIAGTSTES
jgi:hypothetical protein